MTKGGGQTTPKKPQDQGHLRGHKMAIHTLGEVPHFWRLLQSARNLEGAREAITERYGRLPCTFVDDDARVTITAIDPGEMSRKPTEILVRYLGAKKGRNPEAWAVHVNLLPRGVG